MRSSMKARQHQGIDSLFRTIAFYAAVLGCLLICGILVVMISSVIGRIFPQATIYGIIEYSEVFLVGGIFLGLGYAQISGNHVGVDLIVDRFKPRRARWVRRAGLSVGVLAVIWMIGANILKAMHSISIEEYRFGVAMVPIWPARVIIVLGLVIWAILLIRQIVRPGARSDQDSVES